MSEQKEIVMENGPVKIKFSVFNEEDRKQMSFQCQPYLNTYRDCTTPEAAIKKLSETLDGFKKLPSMATDSLLNSFALSWGELLVKSQKWEWYFMKMEIQGMNMNQEVCLISPDKKIIVAPHKLIRAVFGGQSIYGTVHALFEKICARDFIFGDKPIMIP